MCSGGDVAQRCHHVPVANLHLSTWCTWHGPNREEVTGYPRTWTFGEAKNYNPLPCPASSHSLVQHKRSHAWCTGLLSDETPWTRRRKKQPHYNSPISKKQGECNISIDTYSLSLWVDRLAHDKRVSWTKNLYWEPDMGPWGIVYWNQYFPA